MNNKDIFESMGLNDEMNKLSNDVMANLSEKEKGSIQKIQIMTNYRNNIYMKKLYELNEDSFVELNKNLLDFCRSKCINLRSDEFDRKEKECMSNCATKYMRQYEIFDNFKVDYLAFLGYDILIFEKKQIEAMQKLRQLMNNNI